jgi:hypothetical protein
MKAAFFDNPGLENLRAMDNIKESQLTDHHDVLIRVKSLFVKVHEKH